MSFLAQWRHARDRRKRAAVYLTSIGQELPSADIAWLSALAPGASRECAGRELAFARRAVALIVAERDALDDRTASDVAHELGAARSIEARRDGDVARAWSNRWLAYTNALAARGSSEAPAARIARVMLEGAGVSQATPEVLLEATQVINMFRSSANEALRQAFGAASMPEDVRPSALGSASR
jgi:hypothetical protein